MDFAPEVNCSTRLDNARMKIVAQQTVILLVAVLGLTVALAHGTRGSAAFRESDSAFAVAVDSSPTVLRAPEIGFGLGFTMADFTGDTHPDLATVELNGFNSVNAQYVIDVRLSEGGGQLLRLTAPVGGILVTATDVTGDGNLDLVTRAARSGAPVTVFLNDGHGHFTPAEPSAFANVRPENAPGQKFTTEHFYFSATLISPRSNATSCRSESARNPREESRANSSENCEVQFHRFIPSGLDRAPPAIA
jgi:hypothetical protein